MSVELYDHLVSVRNDMRVIIVMDEMDIFTSRSLFSGSLMMFLELMNVSENGVCDVL